MQVISYKRFKKKLKSNLRKVSTDFETVVVNSGKKNIVLLNLHEYSAIQETLYLLKAPNNKRLDNAISEMNKGKFYKHNIVKKK